MRKKSLSLFCLFIFYLFFASEGSSERGGSISVDDAKMLPIYLYTQYYNKCKHFHRNFRFGNVHSGFIIFKASIAYTQYCGGLKSKKGANQEIATELQHEEKNSKNVDFFILTFLNMYTIFFKFLSLLCCSIGILMLIMKFEMTSQFLLMSLVLYSLQ